MQTISQITDPHVIIAIICIVGAGCICGAFVIWHAIECEMMGKK